MKLTLCSLALLGLLSLAADALLTVAEKSEYKATSRHADVLQFCEELAKRLPRIRLGELGSSTEGRKLPLLIVADPPVATAAEAAKSGKLVVFAMGNIHAGEVDGKEALMMLARDLAAVREPGILRELILVFAPIFNADGNERIDLANRRSQNGPADGVGIRANAQGFDLNRDFVKLESPEVRSLVRLLNEWDPAIVIDCHTTNGSYHRYTLTFEGGRCPAGDENLITYTRDVLLPDVSRRLQQATGFRSFFYGNFNSDRTRWETVEPTPRYGTHYVGLRNRIAILSESYSYASFKDRVLVSQGFVHNICKHAAEHRREIARLLQAARDRSVAAGKNPQPGDQVVIQQETAALGRPFALLGYVEELKDGKRLPGQPKEYELTYWGATKATVQVQRPFAYVCPAVLTNVVENLQRHGIAVERLKSETETLTESYRIERITRLAAFQKHQPVTLVVAAQAKSQKLEAGCIVVRTAQPLGDLLVYLLEPHSADGLASWNYFDAALKEAGDFPVRRVLTPIELATEPIPRESEKRP